MNNLIRVVIFVAIHGVSHGQHSQVGPPPSTRMEGGKSVTSIRKQADRVLTCVHGYLIDDNIKDKRLRFSVPGILHNKLKKDVLFEFDQIREFLEDEKNKGLLLVELSKFYDGSEKEIVNKILAKLARVGYKRIVIKSMQSNGPFVIYDSQKKKSNND